MDENRYALMRVALGEAEADLAIVNGSVVNVYSGEVEKASVLIKGDRIAYVGSDVGKAIGSSTRVIDANGKTLVPGFIDGHTHIDTIYSTSELLRFAIKGGTTTIITETCTLSSPLGYEGVIQFLKSAKNQPIKIFITAPPLVTISPVTEEHAITVKQLRQLLRRKEVLGLGEVYWGDVVSGNKRVLDLIAETLKWGKKVEGHSAGATGAKLQAYVSSGISSCHEPTNAEEVRERVRLGLFILIREGEIRREMEAISQLKDDDAILNRLAVSTDGVGPEQLISDGYMEFLVQKAINLGFNPVRAIQMATVNIARHFAIDGDIGGIAPGKYADIVIIPDLKTIRPEHVISNGRVVARNGQVLVPPRRHRYPRSMLNTIHLAREFTADDFTIPAEGRQQVKVRLIEQVTNLVTREALIDMPVTDGQLKADVSQDIIKVAAIERAYGTGKSFTGLIRGLGLKKGAIASSYAWDCGDIIVVGADESDMATAVNRVKEIGGGEAVCAGGRILAEIALPVGGIVSTEPMETIADKFNRIQKAAAGLGGRFPNFSLTIATLTTPAIPFLRICSSGLFNLKTNRFVDLIVE
ncbi:MAG: adenine deaminase [Deltaproteobacteria bacterium]|nr:adenine deaminase [Deltaproteobacteria bacterium]